MKEKLKFCLTVDVEELSMFNDVHPRFNTFDKFKFFINYLIKDIRYDRNGFYKMHKIVSKEKFPISFMLVGGKFKPIKSESFIDYGYHTYSHRRLTTLSKEELKSELRNIYNCKTFTAPMWMMESPGKTEEIFRELKSQGYKVITYRGTNRQILEKKHFYRIEPPFKKLGLTAVYISNTFHGGSPKERIEKIKQEILSSLEKKCAVYCLSTHDFSNKNMKNFIDIIKFVKSLQKKGKLDTINLRDLIDERH